MRLSTSNDFQLLVAGFRLSCVPPIYRFHGILFREERGRLKFDRRLVLVLNLVLVVWFNGRYYTAMRLAKNATSKKILSSNLTMDRCNSGCFTGMCKETESHVYQACITASTRMQLPLAVFFSKSF